MMQRSIFMGTWLPVYDPAVATSGTDQATAKPLGAIDNLVTSVTHGANGLLLNADFDKQTVINACGTGEAAAVWPPVGQAFAAAMTVPAILQDGNAATFYQAGNQWYIR